MNKRKKPQSQNLSLNDYLAQYDNPTLQVILQSFETTVAWEVFKAYLKIRQREFEVASLDLVKYGKTHEASNASGYAQGLSDVSESLIQEFKLALSGRSPVVEDVRPEESEL